MPQPITAHASLDGSVPPGTATVAALRPLPLGQTGPPGLTRSEIENIHDLLAPLSYLDGELAVEGIPVSRLWDGSGSLLLYLADRAVDNYRSIHQAFAPHFDVSINCAIKACYVSGVLSALLEAGAGVEVASELEWRMAHRLGVNPGQIVVNGMFRSPEHARRLISQETHLLDIDSDEELERLEFAARQLGMRPQVLVRVNPLPADAFFSDRSKLGLSPDDAYRLLERAAGSAHLEARGLHAHQLSRCADPALFGRLAERMGELRAEFSAATGAPLDTLDLGGGIETRYLLERAGHTIGDFAAAAQEALGDQPGLHLLLEPGRYVFGDAAIGLTSVLGTKRRAGQDWLITHIGCNLLPPTSDRAYPPLPIRPTGETWSRFHVADPTPAPSRLHLDATLPGDAAQHGLALIGCGAYTAVRASLWSTDLPDIAVLRGGRKTVIFDRAGQDAAVKTLFGIDLDGI
ncbi:MAG TPA: alanine racemase [Solirubrobacteraceae bacterium]|nr:alanine racemase [Solirubrobacteraceae bacterium]